MWAIRRRTQSFHRKLNYLAARNRLFSNGPDLSDFQEPRINVGRVLQSKVKPKKDPGSSARLIQREKHAGELKESYRKKKQNLDSKLAKHAFASLGFKRKIGVTLVQKQLYPLPIQKRAIPAILNQHNVLVQSQTGSGKTLTYVLPALNRLNPNKVNSVVFVVPSRELGEQVKEVCKEYLEDGHQALLVSRAEPLDYHIDMIEATRPPIIIGTAARLRQLFGEGYLLEKNVEYIAMDEADQFLDPLSRYATKRQRYHRVRHPKSAFLLLHNITKANPKVQVVCVGATINSPLRHQIKTICPRPVELITDGQKHSIPKAIQHKYLVVGGRHQKASVLRDLVANSPHAHGTIAFLTAGAPITNFVFKLNSFGVKAVALHTMANYKRVRIPFIKAFESGEIPCVIATELIGRGLDYPWLSRVVLLDLPKDPRSYLHLAGRTGRLGQAGTCLSIVTSEEVYKLKNHCQRLGVELKEVFLEPQLNEDRQQRLLRLSGKIPEENFKSLEAGTLKALPEPTKLITAEGIDGPPIGVNLDASWDVAEFSADEEDLLNENEERLVTIPEFDDDEDE